jgi:RES domain-containing protein
VTLEALIQAWSGVAVRHIPAGSRYDVLDLRFAGRGVANRWNYPGDPTLYLACDRAVALAEFARHLALERSPALQTRVVARAVFRLHLAVDALLDLRQAQVQHALSLTDAPRCFLDRDLARATAQFLRKSTRGQALLVPSIALLDAPDRWNLVLFLEKLPDDPRQFISSVEREGAFTLTAGQ